jgi:hypothetical protein
MTSNKEITMQIHRQKSLFIPLVSGLMIATDSLVAAASISWVPASTAVPMSLSSLIILGTLFMAGGSFLLFKSQTHVARSVLSVILLAGMFGFVKELKAEERQQITIYTDEGSAGLTLNSHIHNDEHNIPIKITIDPDRLQIMYTDCYNNNSILQPGEDCDISLDWQARPF